MVEWACFCGFTQLKGGFAIKNNELELRLKNGQYAIILYIT